MGEFPLQVLLICNDPGDIRFIWGLFKDNQIPNCLDVIRDRMTALAYLRGEGKFQDTPRPDLILFDTRLQLGDWIDIVGALKVSRGPHNIPFVALLGSEHERAFVEVMHQVTDDYVTMPMTTQSLAGALKLIFNLLGRSFVTASGTR